MNPYEPLDVTDILVYLQIGAMREDDGVVFEEGRYPKEIIAKQYDGDDLTLESEIMIHLPEKRSVTRYFPGFCIGDVVTVVFIGSYWENRQGVVHSIDEEKKLIRVYFDFAEAYADFRADELFVHSK